MPEVSATQEAEAGELPEPKEAEVAVSGDRAIALQPGQQERNSISKKKKKALRRPCPTSQGKNHSIPRRRGSPVLNSAESNTITDNRIFQYYWPSYHKQQREKPD